MLQWWPHASDAAPCVGAYIIRARACGRAVASAHVVVFVRATRRRGDWSRSALLLGRGIAQESA
eukprot:9392898-Alexandrium_andersonii.AAC.1